MVPKSGKTKTGLKKEPPPFDTEELRRELKKFLEQPLSNFISGGPKTKAGNSIKLGGVKWGVYAFFDYDDEPIYVGQTRESLSSRIRRHLTNQRTDAVAMSVLDPLEVKTVRVWPLHRYQDVIGKTKSENRIRWDEANDHLDGLERMIFDELISASKFKAILNEKDPPYAAPVAKPESIEGKIASEDVIRLRGHADTRVARRAQIIARLAQVISERELKTTGLRRALVTQAERLRWLADQQFTALGGAAAVETRKRGESEAADDTGDI